MQPSERNHIAIVMCTRNGDKFLAEQLNSFLSQTHQNWSLWISDDGSTDDTEKLILQFKAEHPEHKVSFSKGPVEGFCENFMTLLKDEAIDPDFLAISDQDDVWLPHKLERALQKLCETGAALYGGRTIIVDENQNPIGLSPLFAKKPCLENAIVQSIMGGNTMVVTKEGLAHFRRAPNVNVVSHDWWLYLYLSASGYRVYYDEEPMTLYRQHNNNIVGANIGVNAKLRRLKRLMRSEFRDWNLRHIEALKACDHLLSDHGRRVVKEFEDLHNNHGVRALKKARELNLTRQTRSGELALYLAAVLGKI